jgi:16S rRNA U516 pseudouridylate synthase RsuA-like enzyme
MAGFVSIVSRCIVQTLMAVGSVDLDHSGKTKNALTGDEVAAQTAVIMIAGQDIVSLHRPLSVLTWSSCDRQDSTVLKTLRHRTRLMDCYV